MEQKLIRDLKPGDSIVSFFVVRKKEIKHKRSSNDIYLSLEFGDRSGRVSGSIWKDVKKITAQLQVSNIVKVKGKVITYLDKPHVSIKQIRKALPTDNIRLDQFLPRTDRNPDQMFAELQKAAAQIENSYIRTLLQNIFKDNNIREKFLTAPAAKLWHHNYIGGLLEHTLSLVKLCTSLCELYPVVDRDILIAGAILHDIGKIEELKTEGYIDYSTTGRLIGHIAISTGWIYMQMEKVTDFPDDLKNQLLHCVLSHHGQKEFGSPVVPMTLEALVLHYADELDSSIAAFLRIMKKESEPGKEWSNYVNLLDRFLYLGKSKKALSTK